MKIFGVLAVIPLEYDEVISFALTPSYRRAVVIEVALSFLEATLRR